VSRFNQVASDGRSHVSKADESYSHCPSPFSEWGEHAVQLTAHRVEQAAYQKAERRSAEADGYHL
jgi:hypothetical protein